MPHLVYSDEEIESCLHFILLNVPPGTVTATKDNCHPNSPTRERQQEQPRCCWWPCLVLEHMNMLHSVCRQKNYLQTDQDEAERRAAFLEQCRVQLLGATVRRVVLLLGPSPPTQSRFLFSQQQDWTLRPMLGRAALFEWCSALEPQQRSCRHHHPREVELCAALTEVSMFLAPQNWDSGIPLSSGGERQDDATAERLQDEDGDVIFLLHGVPHGEEQERREVSALVEP